MSSVLISEVGPRDGLQNCRAVMPTAAKTAWISALVAAGLREIEIGSFVSPKLLPQMADTGDVLDYAVKVPGLTVAVLVPNLKGAERAVAGGAHKITLPMSVSETHSMRNIRRTHAQVLEEVRAISGLLGAAGERTPPHFEGSLSTAFGCTLEGPVPEATVLRCAEQLMEAGCDEVGLADTTGYGDPASVRRLIRAVRRVVGEKALTGVHFHNTRGLGLANVLAAYEEGITTFDSSLGGLGGCPTAPGASGNVVTEDLVFLFESMGVSTGIDLEKLMATRALVAAALPGEELYGFTPRAGLPLGYKGAPVPAALGALS